MRKRRFKRSTASIPCCRCRPVGPSGTASSTTAMARSRCWPRSTRRSGEVLGQTVPAAYQRRVCRFPRRHRSHAAEAARDSCHRRQPVDAQDPGRADVSAGSSERAPAFHADVFVLAQSSRALVCQNRTRLLARGIFTVRRRPRAQDSSLHPALQQDGETGPLELSQSGASY